MRRASVDPCRRVWHAGQALPQTAGLPGVMTKSELVQRLRETNPHLGHREVETVVDTVFAQIANALQSGERVELRGFGTFSVRQREARVGRNPRTGASVEVASKHHPVFKAGKPLHHRLNPAP